MWSLAIARSFAIAGSLAIAGSFAIGCTRPPALADPAAPPAAEHAVVDPSASAEAEDAIGEALLLQGAFDRSERAFAKALEVAPRFATAYHGLGVLRYHRGDAAGALVAFEAGIALTPAVDPSYTRTRLVEAVAWVHALEGRTADALRANEASVVAQGLPSDIAPRVVRIGRARLLLHAGRVAEALAETAAARAPGAPPFVAIAAGALAALAHVRAGDLAKAEAALAAIAAAPASAERPDVIDATITLAIAQHHLDDAAARLLALEQLDPYAAEQASLALAHALIASGRPADAKPRLASLATRYLRSVPSAHARRAAASELAKLPGE